MWVFAGQASGADPLLSYGLPGLIASIGMAVIAALWKRDVKARDAELARSNARGDRLETELAQLNRTVHDQTLHALNEATRAVADAMARMRGTQ